MKVLLANPRGFCAGVDRAIEIVELALKKYGPPVYVRHEIVHNKYVVEDLRSKGAVFVDEIEQIPDGAITVFSAHGVSEKVENAAKLRDLPIIDATCPLVTKVHKEAQRYEAEGREIILIGHKGHPEVEGTSGRVNGVLLVETAEDVQNLQVKNPDNLAYVTQTTLSLDDTKIVIDALKERFPAIEGPDTRDICYATQNRQNAVREISKEIDVLLVIGATNSSNSNRLRDLGEEMGVKSYLIAGAEEITIQMLQRNPPLNLPPQGGEASFRAGATQQTPLPEGATQQTPLPEGGVGGGFAKGELVVGVTAGASAPEVLVGKVIEKLLEYGASSISNFDGKKESVKFQIPKILRDAA